MSWICNICGMKNTDSKKTCSGCGNSFSEGFQVKDYVSEEKESGTFDENGDYHLKTGTELNHRYKTGKVMGEGSFGITYEACDMRLQEKVAIKEFYYKEIVKRDVRSSNKVEITYANYRESFFRAKSRFMEEKIKSISQDIASVRTLYMDNNNGEKDLSIYFSRGFYKKKEQSMEEMAEMFLRIFKTCNIDKESNYKYITIWIPKEDSGNTICKVVLHLDETTEYDKRYVCSYIAFEHDETEWIKGLYQKMKKSPWLKGYRMEYKNIFEE